MGTMSSPSVPARKQQLLLCLAVLLLAGAASAQAQKYNAVFNFGDSNSDTGGMAAAKGWHIAPPEGRAFFHHPTGRFCDGRLVIDFLCEFHSRSPRPKPEYYSIPEIPLFLSLPSSNKQTCACRHCATGRFVRGVR